MKTCLNDQNKKRPSENLIYYYGKLQNKNKKLMSHS